VSGRTKVFTLNLEIRTERLDAEWFHFNIKFLQIVLLFKVFHYSFVSVDLNR
jgi:hypothetical protein